MLKEITLYGEIDRVEVAIDRIRSFAQLAEENHSNGYMVLDSGGKDSDVIKKIAHMAHMRHGVKYEIIHCHTTADHPATVRYIRKEQEHWQSLGISYTIVYPTYKSKRTSMWELIPRKGSPTRWCRWCCDYLKEQTVGQDRFTITGVRWAESVRRKKDRAMYELPNGSKKRVRLNNDNDAHRGMIEQCQMRGQFVLNPIIDWEDADIWEFHEKYELPHNPLYDSGSKRVGCVGCPMGDNKTELEAMPKYKAMYIHAFQRFIDRRPDVIEKYGWTDGEAMFKWWIDGGAVSSEVNGQMMIAEDEDGDPSYI